MIYTGDEPIWGRLLYPLHSGTHNRLLFVMRDSEQLAALIGTVFPLWRSATACQESGKETRIMISRCGDTVQGRVKLRPTEETDESVVDAIRCDNE